MVSPSPPVDTDAVAIITQPDGTIALALQPELLQAAAQAKRRESDTPGRTRTRRAGSSAAARAALAGVFTSTSMHFNNLYHWCIWSKSSGSPSCNRLHLSLARALSRTHTERRAAAVAYRDGVLLRRQYVFLVTVCEFST